MLQQAAGLTPLPDDLPPICKALRGKTVDYTAVKSDTLVVSCTDGTEVVIAWDDDKPRLRSVNVKVHVPMPAGVQTIVGG